LTRPTGIIFSPSFVLCVDSTAIGADGWIPSRSLISRMWSWIVEFLATWLEASRWTDVTMPLQ
jgi:hypothetical protein